MISGIRLTNFKCFSDLQLPVRPLTVLSGHNAAGKSSAVQGLMLIAQSAQADVESLWIPLNGSYVQLGTPGDVVREGSSSSGELRVGVENEDAAVEWHLLTEDRVVGSRLRIQQIAVSLGGNLAGTFRCAGELLNALARMPPSLSQCIESLRELVVISAARPVLSDVFPLPYEPNPIHANVGVHGQFAPWWFSSLSDEEIDSSRCHPNEKASGLRRQFAAWAGMIIPGAQANAVHLPRTNLTRLELRIGDLEDWRRPANIGYGLSYAFPIIVAALISKRNQLLFIDSPEAHLHPAAQSAMGKFLAYVAQSGVQVIVETHSDHVVNGVRLAVREGWIDPAKIIFQFFTKPMDRGSSTSVESVSVDADGRMSTWPAGFFDQIERDLARL